MATSKRKSSIPLADPGVDWASPVGEPIVTTAQPDAEQEQQPSGMLRRTLGDTGVSLVKSAVGLPETFVGMADLVTGGRAGKMVEDAGIRFKDTNRALDELYSPEYQAATKKVQSAEGIVDTLKAAFENPSTIYHGAVTSMGSMLAGAPVGRAATALRAPGWLAGGIGEGASAAGQNLEQVRQESKDGLVTGEQTGIIGASGALTAVISSVAGRLANRLGIGDVNQMIAGAQRAGPEVQKGLARKLAEGFATEGLLQEFPQSFQEQVAQNIAQGKPWDEGAANAAVMGGLSGGLLGAGAAPFGGRPEPKPALLPETGPMSRAVNAATVAARGTPLDFTPTEIPAKGDGLAVQPPPDTTALDFEADPRFAGSIAFPNGKAPEQPVFASKQLADIHIGEQGAFGELQAVEAGGGQWTVEQTPEAANRNARANIEMWMERAQPMDEAQAKDMAKRAESELNKPMTALPMPDGEGWTVVPRQWVTAPVLLDYTERAAAAKQAREAPVERAPRTGSTDGVEIDPTGPNAVARYIAEQAATNTPAARAFVQDYRAGRITDADVLALITPKPAAEPTPDERLAAAAKAGQVESDSTAGLILNREGKPFKTEMAAAREQKKHPGSQVVAVEGGHAVQPAPVESANVEAAQAPAAAQEAAVAQQESADSGGAGAAKAGAAGGPGVEAGTGGAVEAAGLKPKETAIQRRSRMKAGRVAAEPKLNMGLPTPEQVQADQKAKPQDSGPSLNESQAEAAPAQAGKPEPAIERRTRKKAERDGAARSGDAGSKASTAQGAPETVIERRTRLKAERAARADGEAAGAGPAAEPTKEQEADTAGKQAEPAPAARVIARVGRTPTAATSLELRTNADGTLTPHMEGSALLDFDSGEPIKLPANVTDAEAKQAIRDAGAISSKQHFYAPADESPPAFSRSAEPLRKLADLAKTATNANETVAVGPVSAEQAALLAAEGVGVTEASQHTADLYAVRHVLNRHGDEATEKARGQLPISADDIALVPEVVGKPDAYAVGPKTKRGDDLVGYIKRMPDGAILYIEELRTGRNRLAMLSMRKYPGAKDFASIAQSLLSNARGDTGDVRIVYPQQGDAQAFSRGKAAQQPTVTVEQDNGFPVYFTDKVRLEFPQPTERLDVIEVDGETVVNYPIMSPTGFNVLGRVELLVKDGKAKALLDIEVDKQGRRAGVGRDVIETLLAADGAGTLKISNIVPEARGFWEKMGIPQQNVEGAYDGKLDWQTYAEAQNPGATRGAAGTSQAARRGTDAGAEGRVAGAAEEAPSTASVKRRQEVEDFVSKVTARWKNAPQVVVVASMADPLVPRAVRQVNAAQLSQGAEGSPEGFFHDGKVYLVAPQLRGDADVVRVLFHEALGHFGLRGTFGAELGTILDRLAVLNAGKVRAKAKQYGLDYDKPSDRRMAAEEVLAEMAQRAPDVGWAKKAVAAIRTWLRQHVPGFSKRAMSDAEIVRNFLLPARAFVQRGSNGSDVGGGTSFSFAGPWARNADLYALSTASQRLDSGEDAETVRQETGWHRGNDGKWRFEISDADAKLTLPAKEFRALTQDGVTVKLGAVMDHPALFAAYPALADLLVTTKAGRGSSYNAASGRIAMGDGVPAGEFLSVLLHEVQHGIQTTEGFARGGGRAEFARDLPDGGFDNGYDAYFRLAGEVEARNTQARQYLSDEARRAFAPSMTADVADSDVIVRFNGKDAEQAPAPANAQRRSTPGAADVRFSRSTIADAVTNFSQSGARNAFLDAVTTHGKTNLWGRTVGTQYHKAQTHPKTFGRVFNAVQDYIKDTSVFANRAADLAPSLLPKLDTAADLMKDGLWRHGADPKDTAKAGEAIFQGTLNKELYDDATLRSRFGLSPKQVELYREFRAAVDQSLGGLGKTEILRIAGEAGRSVRAEVLAAPSLDDAAEILTAAVVGDQAAVQQIQEKVARVTQLQDEGYAPLMRFGKHTLHVTGPGGSTEFFGMYETVRDANRAARQLREDPTMAKFTFTQGVMSEEGHKLFNGLSMDSLELFADTTGRSDDPVFQAYLKLAIANRSALKRMIERQGIKGYSDDVARVLASFVTSNARMSAGHLHLADAKKAAEAIPKEQGDLRDDAIKLVEYVTTPTEEAAAVRGLLFTSFIGGSVASALVNMTQPITMTLPYLTQYGGAAKAGKRLSAAMAMVASGKGMDPELAAALKRAEDDGIVSPQEIHHLQAQAMNTLGKNPLLKKAAFVWGALFSLAEQFNRRVSFVAAYETAKQHGIADPFGFAEKAVIETQGLYNKGNKANVARGAVGATVMTFKQFSTHYLEFLVRMWKSGPEGKKAVAVALALLILMGGAGGLPFADDLDDLIDTLGQAMGYDTNSKRWKRQFVAQTLGLGDAVADVATRGLTAAPGFPLDLSLRMGMGNLLPATGLFLRSNTDTARQLLEVAGAAGGLAANVKDGVTKAMGGDLAGGAMNAMPVAVQNIAKAIQMAQTGEYRNTKGAKVMDVDGWDAAMKGIGFQPAQVARESGRVGEAMRSIQLAKNVEGEIAGRWAQAMVDQDPEGVAAAKKQLADWNAANPTAPIKITIPQVLARVKALKSSRADRTVKAAPKEIRGTVREALS